MEGKSLPQCQDLQGQNQEMARQENQTQGIQDRRQGITFNSRVKFFGQGKLRSKCDGPYTVIHASSHGAITIQDDNGKVFKVNGQRLKVFLEPFNSKEAVDVINLIDFHFQP